MCGGFTIKCRFPRGCVDKVILLRRGGPAGKNGVIGRKETLWKPIKKFEKPWIALSGTGWSETMGRADRILYGLININ